MWFQGHVTLRQLPKLPTSLPRITALWTGAFLETGRRPSFWCALIPGARIGCFRSPHVSIIVLDPPWSGDSNNAVWMISFWYFDLLRWKRCFLLSFLPGVWQMLSTDLQGKPWARSRTPRIYSYNCSYLFLFFSSIECCYFYFNYCCF